MNNKILKYMPWLFLMIMIEPSFKRSTINIFPTFIILAIQTIFIIISFYVLKNLRFFNKKENFLLLITFLWIFICIFRGFIISDNYWEYKNCYTHSLALLSPFSAVFFTIPSCMKASLRLYFKWIIPISIIAIPFFNTWSWFWMYYVFFTMILFYPSIRKYCFFLIFTIFVASIDITARSVLIKVFIAIIFGTLLYYRSFIKSIVFRILTYGIYVITFLLLFLGLSGSFNIFKMDEYLPKTISQDENISEDTRTWLYSEAINSAISNNYIIYGRTPARGYDTSFAPIEDELWKRAKISGDNVNSLRMERNAEVFFLNIFTWTGIVGVCLVSFIYFMASHRALTQANNDFIRIAGLYIAFRYMYGWIEDTLTINGNILCLWMLIGMCLSPYFLKMNNNEFRNFIRNSIKLPI